MTSRRIAALLSHVIVAACWFALPAVASAATRYVTDSGTDSPSCGADLATACRSITQAIKLANAGDTVLVGPGRYGDLNRSGVLGDMPGEETGSPGCGCAVSINKPVIVISSKGAAVTVVDSRTVYLVQNVLLITNGGEFGRPGKGFTVTETRHIGYKANNGHGIVIDSINVMVRGNRVVYTVTSEYSESVGILPVNDAPVRIEGNQVLFFNVGIAGRAGSVVSKNEVTLNTFGISMGAGKVVGNVAAWNRYGIGVSGNATATGNAVYANEVTGFSVSATFSGIMTKNNIFANGNTSSACGLTNSLAGLKAANNYWGAPSGPGAAPANNVCNLSGASATTTPYATTPFAVTVLKP